MEVHCGAGSVVAAAGGADCSYDGWNREGRWMTELDLVIRARRMISTAGEVSGAVGVRGGRIVAVEAYDAPLEGTTHLELQDDEVPMPGLVDSHVHVNDPGRTEWEGF